MTTILLYLGIALIILGWLTLSWFAVKQINAQKEYERFPQKWEEVKQALIYKRWICRSLIVLGIVVLIISLML